MNCGGKKLESYKWHSNSGRENTRSVHLWKTKIIIVQVIRSDSVRLIVHLCKSLHYGFLLHTLLVIYFASIIGIVSIHLCTMVHVGTMTLFFCCGFYSTTLDFFAYSSCTTLWQLVCQMYWSVHSKLCLLVLCRLLKIIW